MTTTVGISSQAATSLELACDGYLARMFIRLLIAAYPVPLKARYFMDQCMFTDGYPNAYIRFSILRTNVRSAIARCGWTIAQDGGTEMDHCVLAPLSGARS